MVTSSTTKCNIIKFRIMLTEYIHPFSRIVRTNSCYLFLQNWLVRITEAECVYCAVGLDLYI